MATVAEALNLLDEQEQLLKQLEGATTIGPDLFQVGTETYNRESLVARTTQTKRSIKELRKSLSPYRKQVKEYNDALARLRRAEEILANPSKELPGGYNIDDLRSDVEKAQRIFNDQNVKYSRLLTTAVTLPEGVQVRSAPARTAGGTGPMGPIIGPSETARPGGTGPMGAIGPQGATGARTARTSAPSPTETIEGVPAATTQQPTPTRRPKGGGGTPPPPPPPPTRRGNWEATFRRMFPAQAWMFDLDRQKYADVFGLFQRAVKQQMFKTPEGVERFAAELQNTSFYKELQDKKVVQQVRDIVGDTGLPNETFNRLLRDTMNLAWDDATIKREVYAEAFRKDPTTGQYVNPQAQARAKASSDYLSIANIGRQFFSSIDPATIESNLTGGFTVEDISRQQRELAKTKYAHLSNLIDQGFTLEQLSADYKGIASNLLEKPEADINMSQADFEVALNFNDNGTYRLMTTGEWERMLRTDDRYGYGNTQQAQQKARQIALNLARSLGKVR